MASLANIAGEADPRVPLPQSKNENKSGDDLTIVQPAYPGGPTFGRQARLSDMMCHAQEQRAVENGEPGDAGYPIPAIVEKYIKRQPLPSQDKPLEGHELTADQAERVNARRALKQASVSQAHEVPSRSNADSNYQNAVGGDFLFDHNRQVDERLLNDRQRLR